MNYLIVKDGIIVNSIVCTDDETAAKFDAVPWYDGANIGFEYNPPDPEPIKPEPTTEERLDNLEASLAQTDDTAIALFEAQLEQEAINTAQDDALIEIYEMLGG